VPFASRASSASGKNGGSERPDAGGKAE
jgi:hypothetical protein